MIQHRCMAGDRRIRAEVGQRIRKARKARGLTGAEFARLIRLSQAQVSRIESGLQDARSPVLFRIASVLRVSPAIFFIGAPLGRSIMKKWPQNIFPGLELLWGQ